MLRYLLLPFEEVCIHLDVAFPFFWDCRLFKNGRDGTGWFAGSAVDTLIWINIQLLALLKFSFTLCWMNAVHRTDIYARCIFHADTRLRNHIGHSLRDPPLSLLCTSKYRAAKLYFSSVSV